MNNSMMTRYGSSDSLTAREIENVPKCYPFQIVKLELELTSGCFGVSSTLDCVPDAATHAFTTVTFLFALPVLQAACKEQHILQLTKIIAVAEKDCRGDVNFHHFSSPFSLTVIFFSRSESEWRDGNKTGRGVGKHNSLWTTRIMSHSSLPANKHNRQRVARWYHCRLMEWKQNISRKIWKQEKKTRTC